ncbi:MAG: hypothetical protein BWK80_46755 [Desulfobacteraceae bacterium IS3]|nr:MAG: hypothetical protein BWK80_46755 [Desulfobacteraceae bacterium IS3]HAO22082.1 hypothetical protein [Desulfobacteraceae bacterium]
MIYFFKIHKGGLMGGFNIFVMRAVLGAGFAVVLMRMFYRDAHPVYTAVLAGFMIGVAYIFEYWRNRKSGR